MKRIITGKWYNLNGKKVQYSGIMIGYEKTVLMRTEDILSEMIEIPHEEALMLSEWNVK